MLKLKKQREVASRITDPTLRANALALIDAEIQTLQTRPTRRVAVTNNQNIKLKGFLDHIDNHLKLVKDILKSRDPITMETVHDAKRQQMEYLNQPVKGRSNKVRIENELEHMIVESTDLEKILISREKIKSIIDP